LDQLKGTAEDIEGTIDKQGLLLKSTLNKSEGTKTELNKQSNDLKKALEKHKSGKQCCFDLCLLFTFLALAGLLIQQLQSKGYI
jgi:hypothetical protein